MLILLAILSTADAFRLSAHRALTEAAVEAEDLQEVGRLLWRGNRAEDLRLDIKWRLYSHYYRPDATLTLPRRGTSDRRVALLWQRAQRAAEDGDIDAMWFAVGGVIHQVQDMASPPHVVPIAHDLRDGFERYMVTDLIANLPLEAPDPIDPIVAHQTLAWETWEQVRVDAVEGCGQIVPLSEVWQAPEQTDFGGYGSWKFGDVGDCLELADACDAVMVGRLSAAVFFTRAILRYIQRAPLLAGVDAGVEGSDG